MQISVDIIELDGTDAGIDHRRLEAIVRFVLEREGAIGDWAVTVVLCDDDRLRELYRDFMGIDEVTDVMTFPSDEVDGPGGEIVVSVERATEQGPERGLPAAQEVEFLVAHGMLHLCGWDDLSDEQRAQMLDRQRQLLGELFPADFKPDVS